MTDRLDLEDFFDRQPVGWFHVRVVGLCFLVMLSDGYDLQAAAYAAPGLVRDWHVSGGDLGPLFSASLFGMLLGGPLLAQVGDRWGRRRPSCSAASSTARSAWPRPGGRDRWPTSSRCAS